MADDSVSATRVINAPAEAIFAVLADPAKHAAIDGTGWVRETLDSKPLTTAGQIFRLRRRRVAPKSPGPLWAIERRPAKWTLDVPLDYND